MRITTNGIEVECRVEGRGRTVVLVHGLGSTLNTWEGVARSLSSSYQVVRFDLRGSGRSDVPEGPYSIETWVDDVDGVLDELEVETAHFVGHSLGSIISTKYAIEHPDRVASLSLAAAGPGMPEEKVEETKEIVDAIEADGMEAHADTEVEESLSTHTRETRPELAGLYRDLILQNDPDGYVASMRGLMNANLRGELEDVPVPTLLLAAENDVVTPPVASFIMADRIPDAQVTVLQRAGHMAHLEAPEELSRSVHDFIANL
ncbi:alpha/beta fold hydrolase [Natrarchaeobius oligotrophus]|uniref:Alpha/beta fold hydrolase n=1 Tax=Natrarchaeobius chitinivorans TaxID=1679083 RepID=A0A3N6MEC3_NATCH|nr:alpha/beta fold hydrolase [Natrarchaeobius chitinivorans]RQH02314.1 alpha/beta fold hydrolase [Natrarchaeobius chitinivorans]